MLIRLKNWDQKRAEALSWLALIKKLCAKPQYENLVISHNGKILKIGLLTQIMLREFGDLTYDVFGCRNSADQRTCVKTRLGKRISQYLANNGFKSQEIVKLGDICMKLDDKIAELAFEMSVLALQNGCDIGDLVDIVDKVEKLLKNKKVVLSCKSKRLIFELAPNGEVRARTF